MKKDYKIGRGKPPVATRFTKGQSGNPRGRPSRARAQVQQEQTSLADDLSNELQQLVTIKEAGKSQKVTKRQLFVKSLLSRAMTNSKYAALTLGLIQQYGLDQVKEDNAMTFRITAKTARLIEAVRLDPEIYGVTSVDEEED